MKWTVTSVLQIDSSPAFLSLVWCLLNLAWCCSRRSEEHFPSLMANDAAIINVQIPFIIIIYFLSTLISGLWSSWPALVQGQWYALLAKSLVMYPAVIGFQSGSEHSFYLHFVWSGTLLILYFIKGWVQVGGNAQRLCITFTEANFCFNLFAWLQEQFML